VLRRLDELLVVGLVVVGVDVQDPTGLDHSRNQVFSLLRDSALSGWCGG
jgi:hypothetical protein